MVRLERLRQWRDVQLFAKIHQRLFDDRTVHRNHSVVNTHQGLKQWSIVVAQTNLSGFLDYLESSLLLASFSNICL